LPSFKEQVALQPPSRNCVPIQRQSTPHDSSHPPLPPLTSRNSNLQPPPHSNSSNSSPTGTASQPPPFSPPLHTSPSVAPGASPEQTQINPRATPSQQHQQVAPASAAAAMIPALGPTPFR
jgi:hypothetical protein